MFCIPCVYEKGWNGLLMEKNPASSQNAVGVSYRVWEFRVYAKSVIQPGSAFLLCIACSGILPAATENLEINQIKRRNQLCIQTLSK